MLGSALTCTTDAVRSSPVGSYATQCSGAADPNYAISYATGTTTITPAPLSITASSGSMTYGGAVSAITPSISGLQNGDNPSVLGAGTGLWHDCDQLEQRGELRQHVLWGSGRQLRHQLRQRQCDHDSRAAFDHGVVGNHDLRGVRTDDHADRFGSAKRR